MFIIYRELFSTTLASTFQVLSKGKVTFQTLEHFQVLTFFQQKVSVLQGCVNTAEEGCPDQPGELDSNLP